MTLAAKHEVVDDVLQYPADSLFRTHLLKALFPLHQYPTPEEVARGSGHTVPQAADSVFMNVARIGQSGIASFLLPALAAGREGEVRAVVDTVLQRVLNDPPGRRERIERWLLIISFGILGVYVVVVVRGRLPRLRAKTGAENAEDPPELVRRVALLGLCVGLLLASPIGGGGQEALAEKVMGALPHYRPPAEEAEVRAAIVSGVHGQAELLGTLRVLGGMSDTTSLLTMVTGIAGQVAGVRTRLDAAGDAAAGLGRRVDSLLASVAAVGAQVEALREVDRRHAVRLASDSMALQRLRADVEGFQSGLDSVRRAALAGLRQLSDSTTAGFTGLQSRLQALERDLAATRGKELLIVDAGAPIPYRILRGRVLVDTGATAGAHWLPAGDYLVRNRQDSMPVTLRLGRPLWVNLRNIQ
jgi:hypothetical protein